MQVTHCDTSYDSWVIFYLEYLTPELWSNVVIRDVPNLWVIVRIVMYYWSAP